MKRSTVARLALCPCLAFLVACSSKLSHDVMVPKTGTHVVVKTVTETGKNANDAAATCSSEIHQFVSLPTGEEYGLNVKTGRFGWFASNELSVSFYENGMLKQVTLNSDPQVDETLQASANLVKELGAALGPALGAARAAPETCPTKEITVKETVHCVLPFSKWQENRYKCDA
jgi:hypothetical protein